MPWTVGLLFTSTLFAWVIGNLVGLYVGLNPRRFSARVIENAAIVLDPIPYYMMALMLIILFTYIWPLFPLSTSIIEPGWSFKYVGSILYNSTLPGLSIALSSFGWWVISMKALASGVNEEDYVRFARLRGVPPRVVATKYVLRNALLPQITVLAIQLGLLLSGSILGSDAYLVMNSERSDSKRMTSWRKPPVAKRIARASTAG